MDQVINELSVLGEYPDKYVANLGMQQMLAVSKEVAATGFNSTIRTTRDFVIRDLTKNYSIQTWATETADTTQREFQRYFLTIATKGPYIEDFISETETEDKIVEFRHELGTALGVGLAELWNAPVLSLEVCKEFQEDFINVSKMIVTEGGEENQEVRILNLYEPKQVKKFHTVLKNMACPSVARGIDLLRESEQLFPRLKICENACKQIKKLTGSEQFFPEILRHLLCLNKTMEDYVRGSFDPVEINWSVESTSTLQQFPGCRTFECQDGENRIFSSHSKILSANKRMYFIPLPAEKIVHIGYVGDHLPTVRYKT